MTLLLPLLASLLKLSRTRKDFVTKRLAQIMRWALKRENEKRNKARTQDEESTRRRETSVKAFRPALYSLRMPRARRAGFPLTNRFAAWTKVGLTSKAKTISSGLSSLARALRLCARIFKLPPVKSCPSKSDAMNSSACSFNSVVAADCAGPISSKERVSGQTSTTQREKLPLSYRLISWWQCFPWICQQGPDIVCFKNFTTNLRRVENSDAHSLPQLYRSNDLLLRINFRYFLPTPLATVFTSSFSGGFGASSEEQAKSKMIWLLWIPQRNHF